ncbi:toll/interleukin-1 receptor domain-containing protein [Flavobacterium soyae]|uniref:toll/interleukin-1 receptor domain-containing protein n=1 Tax=Flavobacterium soyae TaxID=2903098 RepID=UPI001E4C0A6E|nr:toll/interleukin-1 receptor domain-containing protein [Flavobacterium soyae]MCD9576331.1 toll/interleukin-1 receptor domain-containing protein [Flavobacterium soyae]
MKIINYPLNIYVVWHPDSLIGKRIAEDLYSTFCRDYQNPLSRGINIPVYFRYIKLDSDMPLDIDITNAEKNAIILLIDEEYFLDQNFRNYTEEISKKIDHNNRVFPISLCEKAYSIGCNLSTLQFTDGTKFFDKKLKLNKEKHLIKSIKKIKTELLHDCSRLLLNFHPKQNDKENHRIGSPVKLFLSHAKKDGEITTIRFKKFIQDNLKLDVFFDTVDIANGYDFAEQFENEIKHSALVVFHTDEYSNREWCRREVLIAKKHKSPIVVVHNIIEGEKRAFPYLGNVPTTVIFDDELIGFYRILNLTLYQVLNNLYQNRLLEYYKDIYKTSGSEIKTLTSPPELFNFLDIKKYKIGLSKKLIMLYPDPPLGIEELNILNELDEDVEFTTPINLNL